MPANISPAITPAAAAGQFALNGPGATDGASGASGATEGGAGSFASLFQQLAGKQLAVAVDENRAVPNADALQADTTTATEGAAGSLNAMLPFLEAMGLAQTGMPADGAADAKALKTKGSQGTEDASRGEDVLAAVLTPPVANDPAISAVPTANAGNRSSDVRLASAPDVSTDKPKTPASTQQSGLPGAIQQNTTENDISEFSTILGKAAEQSSQTQMPPTTVNLSQAGSGPSIEETKVRPPSPENATQTLQVAASEMSGHHAAQPSVSPATTTGLSVAQPVGSPGWSEAVGNQVVWMANRHESRAELVLNPPHMGRVEVSLTVSGDQANASFASSNPHVRDALEAALPRLREVLADAGIQLGQAQVGAENPRQPAQQEKNGDNPGFGRDPAGNAGEPRAIGGVAQSPVALKPGRGLVDVFA